MTRKAVSTSAPMPAITPPMTILVTSRAALFTFSRISTLASATS
jgi:hypothetical protein